MDYPMVGIKRKELRGELMMQPPSKAEGQRDLRFQYSAILSAQTDTFENLYTIHTTGIGV